MSKSLSYQSQLRADKIEKLKELQKVLPVYTHPYLDSMRVDYQPNTLIAYARDLITFFSYLKDNNPTLKDVELKDIPLNVLDSLSVQDIIEYRNYLSYTKGKHSNQPSSIARRLAPLRGFFESANDLGYLHNNPTVNRMGLRNKKADKREIVYMEPEEVRQFVNITENSRLTSERQQKFAEKTQLRDTAITTLLLNTGIRVSECVGIDIDDLNFYDNSVVITRKGGASQIIYFSDRVAGSLEDYIRIERPKYMADKDEKALFLSLKKKRMSVRSIEYMVKKYAREAVPGKKITPHKLRSTYGTALYDETGDINLVAAVLGHESIETTAKHYAALKEKHRKDAGRINLY